MLKLWRVIDELEIGEQQAAALFPYWSKNQRDKRGLAGERREATGLLDSLLKAGDTTDAELQKQIVAIGKVDKRMHDQEKAFRDGLGKYLDVRQQARLLVFEERFRGDLRDMVRGFRRRNHEGEGPPGRDGGAWGEFSK